MGGYGFWRGSLEGERVQKIYILLTRVSDKPIDEFCPTHDVEEKNC